MHDPVFGPDPCLWHWVFWFSDKHSAFWIFECGHCSFFLNIGPVPGFIGFGFWIRYWKVDLGLCTRHGTGLCTRLCFQNCLCWQLLTSTWPSLSWDLPTAKPLFSSFLFFPYPEIIRLTWSSLLSLSPAPWTPFPIRSPYFLFPLDCSSIILHTNFLFPPHTHLIPLSVLTSRTQTPL